MLWYLKDGNIQERFYPAATAVVVVATATALEIGTIVIASDTIVIAGNSIAVVIVIVVAVEFVVNVEVAVAVVFLVVVGGTESQMRQVDNALRFHVVNVFFHLPGGDDDRGPEVIVPILVAFVIVFATVVVEPGQLAPQKVHGSNR